MSLIEEYVEYASAMTDSPKIFHRALGYYLVSTLIGRYATIPVSYSEYGIRPNIWVLLIGPSGLIRKTTALHIARNIIFKVDKRLFLPEEYSPEALYEALSVLETGDSATWMRDEFGSFFRSMEKDYMKGVKGLLSQTYSGVGGTRKLRKKTFQIQHGIYVTVTSALPTPASAYFTEDDFRTGLLNRFLLVYAEEKEKWYSPLNLTENYDIVRHNILNLFIKKTKRYQNVKTTVINFDSKAKKFIDNYSQDIERIIKHLNKVNPYGLWQVYITRAPEYLIKLSALEWLADNDPLPMAVVTRDYVDRAYKFLNSALSRAKQVVSEVETAPRSVNYVTHDKPLTMVYNIIKSYEANGITVRDLYSKTRMTKTQLKEYVITLLEADKVIAVTPRKKTRGRKGVKLYSIEYKSQAILNGEVITPKQLSLLW